MDDLLVIQQSENPWDMVAPIWSVFERGGLNPDNLRQAGPKLNEPILVVGAGQGIVLESLLSSGLQAVGVDGSVAMIDEAFKRRGLRIENGQAENLPFDSGVFGTVVVATGVLQRPGIGEISRIFAEFERINRDDGNVVLAFFSDENPEKICHPAFDKASSSLVWSYYCDVWLSGKRPIFEVIRKYFQTDAETDLWIRDNTSELLATIDLASQMEKVADEHNFVLKDLLSSVRDRITVPIPRTEAMLASFEKCGFEARRRFQQAPYLSIVEGHFRK